MGKGKAAVTRKVKKAGNKAVVKAHPSSSRGAKVAGPSHVLLIEKENEEKRRKEAAKESQSESEAESESVSSVLPGDEDLLSDAELSGENSETGISEKCARAVRDLREEGNFKMTPKKKSPKKNSPQESDVEMEMFRSSENQYGHLVPIQEVLPIVGTVFSNAKFGSMRKVPAKGEPRSEIRKAYTSTLLHLIRKFELDQLRTEDNRWSQEETEAKRQEKIEALTQQTYCCLQILKVKGLQFVVLRRDIKNSIMKASMNLKQKHLNNTSGTKKKKK